MGIRRVKSAPSNLATMTHKKINRSTFETTENIKPLYTIMTSTTDYKDIVKSEALSRINVYIDHNVESYSMLLNAVVSIIVCTQYECELCIFDMVRLFMNMMIRLICTLVIHFVATFLNTHATLLSSHLPKLHLF